MSCLVKKFPTAPRYVLLVRRRAKYSFGGAFQVLRGRDCVSRPIPSSARRERNARHADVPLRLPYTRSGKLKSAWLLPL